MGRLLGIDFGSKRVGLALSDPIHIIASPLKTITYDSEAGLIDEIRHVIAENNVEKIVIGYPIGMKGQITPQTEIVERFIKVLSENIIVPIEKMDERLSSVEAERSLQDAGIKVSRNKEKVDKTAAAIILRSYIDKLSFL